MIDDLNDPYLIREGVVLSSPKYTLLLTETHTFKREPSASVHRLSTLSPD